MQFDQNIPQKLINPIHKYVLTILDDEGREIYRVADPRTNLPDRIFGVGPDAWAILRGDSLVATIDRMARDKEPPPGPFRKLKAYFATRDTCLVSLGGDPILPAPAALGMLLIIDELTASRSGGAS